MFAGNSTGNFTFTFAGNFTSNVTCLAGSPEIGIEDKMTR